jgi:hypothetical protein
MRIKVITDENGLVRSVLPPEDAKVHGTGGPEKVGIAPLVGQFLHEVDMPEESVKTLLAETSHRLRVKNNKLVKAYLAEYTGTKS